MVKSVCPLIGRHALGIRRLDLAVGVDGEGQVHDEHTGEHDRVQGGFGLADAELDVGQADDSDQPQHGKHSFDATDQISGAR